jgi:hypothetical protein
MKQFFLLGAFALASTAASAADVAVVINEGVQTLPFKGSANTPILAYDDEGEHGTSGSAFVSTAAPRSGNGSLELHGDRSRYVIGNIYGSTDPVYGAPAASQSLFSLSQLNSYTFDWQVGTPSTGSGAHNTPAVRLHIIDNGIRSEMIWEGVYNGGVAGTLPATGWQTAGPDSLFYLNLRSGPTTGVYTENGSQVNRTIGGWQSYFSSNAYVTGLSFGAGSGFGSQYVGFVDNVNVGIGGDTYKINFEAASAAVPEPASWALMLGGFGLAGASIRRRRSAVRVIYA